MRAGVASSGDMLPPELGIALGHLDIGMPENFGHLVEIAAVHHVPESENVTQVMEPEVRDICSPEQILETSFESASVAIGPLPRRENSIVGECAVPGERGRGDGALRARRSQGELVGAADRRSIIHRHHGQASNRSR